MAICNYLAPNGEKSLLAAALLQNYGPDVTARMWNYATANMDKYTLFDVNGEPVMGQVVALFPIKPDMPTGVVLHTGNYTSTVTKVIGRPQNEKTQDRATIEELNIAVKAMYAEALMNPNIEYSVPYTRTSDTAKYSNGYTAINMAHVFVEAGPVPPNVTFTRSFMEVINRLPSRYAIEYEMEDQEARMMKNLTGAKLDQQRDQLFIPILNAEGQHVSNFTSSKQLEAVDTVMYLVYNLQQRNPKANVYNMFQHAIGILLKKVNVYKAQGEVEKATDLLNIVGSFSFSQESGRASITSMVLSQLEHYGLGIKNKEKVLKDLELDKNKALKASNVEVLDGDLEFIEDSDTMKLIDEFDDSAILEEGSALRNYSDIVFELNPKDTSSWKLKLFMANLEDTQRSEVNGVVKYESIFNSIGFPRLANFDNTYDKVMGVLADNDNTYENYLQKMRDNAKSNPIFNTIVTKLEGRPADLVNNTKAIPASDQRLKNEFTKVMSVHYTRYMMMTHTSVKKDGKTSWILNPFESNRASQVQHLIASWQESQKLSPAMIIRNGARVMDVKAMQGKPVSWIRAFNVLFNELPQLQLDAAPKKGKVAVDLEQAQEALDGKKIELAKHLATALGGFIRETRAEGSKLTQEEHDAKEDARFEEAWKSIIDTGKLAGVMENSMAMVKSVIEVLMMQQGINFTPAMCEDLVENIAFHTRGTSVAGATIGSQFRFTDNGQKPAGIFSLFVWKAAGLNKASDDVETTSEDESAGASKASNPLHTESTSVRILARVAANNTELLTSSSSRSVEGKQVYDYTLNTALSIRMRKLLSDDSFEAAYDELDTVHISKDNFLVTEWRNSSSSRKAASMFIMDGMRSSKKTSE
jgi:hypothetical protein